MLRKPVILDVPFIYECAKDFPPTPEKGYVTFDKVDAWVRRWIHRDDEEALVWPELGYVSFRVGPYWHPLTKEQVISPFGAVIDNLAVHPTKRGIGNSKKIQEELKRILFDRGVLAVSFKTIPGGGLREKYGPIGIETAWN